MATKSINIDTKENPGIIQKLGEDHPLVKKLLRAEKRITTASAKAKGRDLQQAVCRGISRITGIPYEQSDDSCLIHSREMGQAGVDVILRGEARARFPYAVECKATETMSMPAFIRQAKQYQAPGLDWLVVTKNKEMGETVVILAWEAFERLFPVIEKQSL